ncbi:MAG: hypothetical protein JO246_17115, partial [Frankiaceae bacterium]|nr:hypothetical protein [Frankiaceae bacterium]
MLSRILRPLSIGTAALIAGLSILGCVAMRTSVASERTRILDERAAAVTYLIEATFQEQLASLKELGAVAAADPGDAQQTLTAGAKPFLAGEQAFVAVVRPTARGYRIEGVVGGGQQVGSILTGKAHLTLADAGAHSLTGASMVVPTRSGPVMGIAVPIAGRVVFVESAIDPTPVSTVASPFSDLRGALYAAPTDRPSSLVFTNDANLPIVGNPSSRTAFLVGDNEWSMYLT